MIRSILILLLVAFCQTVFSQGQVYKKVTDISSRQSRTKTYDLFTASEASKQARQMPGDTANRLKINEHVLKTIKEETPEYLSFTIPDGGEDLKLELIPKEIYGAGYNVVNSSGQVVNGKKGLHYMGIVNGNKASLAAISITDAGLSGFVSVGDRNYELGKLPDDPGYVFYNTKVIKKAFECGVKDDHLLAVFREKDFNTDFNLKAAGYVACRAVEIYFEADYSIFQNRGSVQATIDYVNSVFGQVAVMYENEGIEIVISQIKVWDTADPYINENTASAYLGKFVENVNTSFNGDLAHALSARNLGGGIAQLDMLCNKGRAVTGNIDFFVGIYPVYSWDVSTIVHELGHNFGSRHTHSCTWPGGAIDNCASVESGSCPSGPAPVNGGTIMSYCHLNNTIGINLAHGFGPLPGALIRNRVRNCMGDAESGCSTAQCHEGGITFNSQAEIDNFGVTYGHCNIIYGNVEISGGDITNLAPLGNLEEIRGILYIRNTGVLQNLSGLSKLKSITGLMVFANAQLQDLNGLSALEQIEEFIYAESNPELKNLNGLSGTRNISGYVIIRQNNSLQSLSGLSNLESIGGILTVAFNPQIQNLNGLEGLAQINGHFDLSSNANLQSLSGLQNLKSIGSFDVGFNGNLANFTGLSALEVINGRFSVYNNDGLMSFEGMSSAFKRIKGDLFIGANGPLQTLNGLSSLEAIEGGLGIRSHNWLTSITGIQNIDPGSLQNLEISQNRILSLCDPPGFLCAYLTTGKPRNINSNGDCPNEAAILPVCLGCPAVNSITFSSQAEIDAFATYASCEVRLINVTISGADIVNLNGLSGIKSISGDLTIRDNPNLQSLSGLSNLEEIGGRLTLSSNAEITDLAGLSNINSVGGEISITANNKLLSTAGLSGISQITGGTLSFINNPVLTDLSGLSGLTAIKNNWGLIIRRNNSLLNLSGLSNLTELTGGITIDENALLQNIDAFSGLNYLRSITITGNTELQNLNGLSNIEGTGGAVDISFNPRIQNLNGLSGLKTLNNGNLLIRNNALLNNISGVAGIAPEAIFNLIIQNNSSLSVCHIANICTFLGLEGKLKTISGNTGDCVNLGAVTTACSAPPAECPVNVTLTTQAEVDAFVATYSHCSTITGNMTVSGAGITNLSGLTFLQHIGGNLDIEYNNTLQNLTGLSGLQTIGGRLDLTSNSQLQNVNALSGLQTIGGGLDIGANALLTNLSGLSALQTIGGELRVAFNYELQNIDALTALETIGGRLYMIDNPKLQNLNGLSGLKSIGGELSLWLNAQLQNLDGLSGVQSIGGRLDIFSNALLETLTGLSGVQQSIGGELNIYSNAKLQNLNGLQGLQGINGPLFIFNNPELQNLDGLSGLQNIGGNSARIGNNPQLSSIQGIRNIDPNSIDGPGTTFAPGLGIEGNGNLSICDLPNICAYLATDKPRTISGNLGECATEAAVITACSVPPVECPVNITFNAQSQIDDFGITYAHCTTISGNVTIQGPVTNLNGLAHLKSIGGDLYIGDATSSSNPILQNLNGLGALQNIGGWLSLAGLPQLQSLDGLTSLQTLGGPLFITNNPMLQNLDELSDFHNLLDEVYIGYNAILTNVDGLSGLVNIPGRLVLTNNPQLNDISGVSGVQSIGKGLYIYTNPQLENLNALSGVTSIGDDLQIYDNAQLTSVQGLENADLSAVTFLRIVNNGALSVCNLPNICAYLATEKNRSISNNLGNCATEAAVKTACSTPSGTLTLGVGINPTLCEGKDGSIAFTTNLEAGSYTLNFKRGEKDTTATVTVAGGAFTLTGLGKGVYSGFSIAWQEETITAPGERTLTDPAAHTFAAGTLTHPTTCNGVNGSIAFTTNLPAGTYDINFKKGSKDTTATVTVSAGAFTITGLSAASYSAFSITNAGCSYTLAGPVTLTAAAGTLTLQEKKDPTVCNATNGSITFTTNLTAGAYPISFKKGSKDTAATVTVNAGAFTLSGLSAASYSAFSITNEGCSYTLAGPVELHDPATAGGPITAEGSLELCEGEMVKLTAPQGVSYEWSTGAATQSIWASEGGIYKVKVKSAQGCVSESQITVTRIECNVPPMAVCKPVVVLVAKDDCYAILRIEDLDGGSYDLNNDWFNRSIDIDPALRVGSYKVRMTAVDVKGASTWCESDVHVVDHTPPVVRARGLKLELNAQGKASIAVADADAGSYDNCGTLQLSLNRTEFDCSDLGHHQVILTGTDGSGNSSTALVDVHVVDNTPPVVITKALEIALDENGRATLNAEDLAGSIHDNCGIWSIQASKTEFNCDDIGQNTVILKVEDVQGGVTEAEVTVTVTDNTPPVLHTNPVTVYLDAEGKAEITAETVGAGSSDNCGIDSLTLSRTEFDCADIGEHEVTLKGTDKSGNESEQTVIITVADTTAPVILANDVTLYLDAGGKATLTTEQADGGSTDNCGIQSRELQYTDFSCIDLGEHTVQYTVRDKSGNESITSITVTVRDTTVPVAMARDMILELDATGQASLQASAINDGSYDNCGIETMSISQSDFTCTDLGKRLITLTVKDASGNVSTAGSEVLIRDPEGICPCSYGMLAENKIVLRNNEVNAGGIGTSSSKGMVKLRNTAVSQDGTFVRSEQTRFDNESESSVYIRGRAPQPESFRTNQRKEKKTEKIKKGETRTFTSGSYGKIKGKKESKLVFSGGDIQIRSIKLGKAAQVSFTAATVLLVRDHIKLGKETELNRAGEQARVYSGGNVKIGSGSEVKGYIHSRGNLKTTGSGDKYLEGFFAAGKIKGGRNTNWSGGGLLCRENENQALLAKEKGEAALEEEKEEITADSVAEGPGLRVRVWPNTFTTRLEVEIVSESDGGEVFLIDIQGNVLKREGYSGKEKILNMQTDKLDAGLYILRVNSGGQVRTLRVIKNER